MPPQKPALFIRNHSNSLNQSNKMNSFLQCHRRIHCKVQGVYVRPLDSLKQIQFN